MARPKPPAHVIAEALRLAATGLGHRDVAAQIRKRFRRPCAHQTVSAWVRDAQEDDAPESDVPIRESQGTPPLDLTERTEVSALEGESDNDSGDVLELARAIVRDQRATAKRAKEDGNHAAAQRALKAAGDAANLIARIEAQRAATAGGEGAVVFTKEQLESARRMVFDRVAALAADLERTGGLVCSHCGREIRLAIAKGES